MTPEAGIPSNIDLFRQALDANNRGDVDAVIAMSTDDIVIWAGRSAVGGEYRGHAGVREFHADNAESFEEWRLEYPDVRDLGDGRVLALGRTHLKGKGGGVEIDVPSAGIATFENGKVKRWHDYMNHREALAAAGLAS